VGLSFYTLGQRKGIGLGGINVYKDISGANKPWYVAKKDMKNNILYIVQHRNHPWLVSSTLEAKQFSWISGFPKTCVQSSAKTRYRQSDIACKFSTLDEKDNLQIKFIEPQWAVTPGQSVVLYNGDICLGGGIIESSSID
jgi:tRNA-specific 2-thiouridylase